MLRTPSMNNSITRDGEQHIWRSKFRLNVTSLAYNGDPLLWIQQLLCPTCGTLTSWWNAFIWRGSLVRRRIKLVSFGSVLLKGELETLYTLKVHLSTYLPGSFTSVKNFFQYRLMRQILSTYNKLFRFYNDLRVSRSNRWTWTYKFIYS